MPGVARLTLDLVGEHAVVISWRKMCYWVLGGQRKAERVLRAVELHFLTRGLNFKTAPPARVGAVDGCKN